MKDEVVVSSLLRVVCVRLLWTFLHSSALLFCMFLFLHGSDLLHCMAVFSLSPALVWITLSGSLQSCCRRRLFLDLLPESVSI